MDGYLLAGFLLGLSVGCVVTFAVCMYAAQRWLLEQRDRLVGLKEMCPVSDNSFPVESVGEPSAVEVTSEYAPCLVKEVGRTTNPDQFLNLALIYHRALYLVVKQRTGVVVDIVGEATNPCGDSGKVIVFEHEGKMLIEDFTGQDTEGTKFQIRID